MGQDISTDNCVNLLDLPAEVYEELTSETYTVIRTGGWLQRGWRIPSNTHDCPACPYGSQELSSLACNRVNLQGVIVPLKIDAEKYPWKVYMVFDGEDSDMESKKHACGWRRSTPGSRSFWPSRLDGTTPEAIAAIEAWGLRLDGFLNALKTPDDINAAENAKAEQMSQLDRIYDADEHKRRAAGKVLRENPVATPAMMAEMRQRETTGTRCLRNKVIPIPPGSNFALKIKELEKVSVHDADRLRRLFDCGCPKEIVHWLACFENCHSDRNQFITEEEAKLYLEPLEKPQYY
jgi:hypothetical protein